MDQIHFYFNCNIFPCHKSSCIHKPNQTAKRGSPEGKVLIGKSKSRIDYISSHGVVSFAVVNLSSRVRVTSSAMRRASIVTSRPVYTYSADTPPPEAINERLRLGNFIFGPKISSIHSSWQMWLTASRCVVPDYILGVLLLGMWTLQLAMYTPKSLPNNRLTMDSLVPTPGLRIFTSST